MPFRKKSDAPVTSLNNAVEDGPTSAASTTAGKGRPTPKRRESQAALRRPLVADTKGATKEQKQKLKAKRAKAREGMLRGDQNYLAPRDKGPEKRFLRDAVDRRRNIGEVLIPLMLLILAASLISVSYIQYVMFAGAYGLILFGLVDAILLWRRTRTAFVKTFDVDPPKGAASYVVLRSFQMRMSRVPRAVVERGAELRRRL